MTDDKKWYNKYFNLYFFIAFIIIILIIMIAMFNAVNNNSACVKAGYYGNSINTKDFTPCCANYVSHCSTIELQTHQVCSKVLECAP